EKGILNAPALYISYFLKKNRTEYYDRMMEVRNKGNFEQWVKFFLLAILESAEDAADKIKQLSALHTKSSEVVAKMGRAAKNAMLLLSYLEANPIIETQKTADALGLAFSTTSAAIKRLLEVGILVQSAGERRNRVFSYEEYLALLREGT
ncbi:MAG: Fic family protein, partial [Oscillospiraceae bacterium]|nr:Fic family protein [Oscillospiraceae bacterium]